MKTVPAVTIVTAILICAITVFSTEGAEFDFVIADGRIVDGTGAPWCRGDVGIIGDRIGAMGDLRTARTRARIDANGLVVAPGFIDMLGQSEFNLLVDNRAASKVTQGVTTEITGEGSSIAPINQRMILESRERFEHFHLSADWHSLAEYFKRLEQSVHPAVNLGTFVGAGGLRNYVIGKEGRPANTDELAAMKRLTAEAMEQGALGLSSSLQYVPDRFASTEELIELARVAAKYGGIYITHQRSEGGDIFTSLDEVFTIAERAKIPAEIFHIKCAYKSNWGKMPEVLRRIEAARERGLDITANQYPYTRASNGLDACLPLWVREGGVQKMIGRLQDKTQRQRIKEEMESSSVTGWENQWYGSGGGDGILLSSVLNPELRHFEGLTFTQIGQELRIDPRDAVMDLVIRDKGESSVITSIMNEEDVRIALKSPLVSVGTDSAAQAEDGALSESKSHPRGWASFPRILAKYVRTEHLLTLEEAIRKMTSRPAIRVGLQDRGILRPGMAADITIFDAAQIQDLSTFEVPTRYSSGIRYVFVNGRPVLANGTLTTERPGRVLRGPGFSQPHS
jgi:dihydroorotase/N-acyl-D-amino-acid deacylase